MRTHAEADTTPVVEGDAGFCENGSEAIFCPSAGPRPVPHHWEWRSFDEMPSNKPTQTTSTEESVYSERQQRNEQSSDLSTPEDVIFESQLANRSVALDTSPHWCQQGVYTVKAGLQLGDFYLDE